MKPPALLDHYRVLVDKEIAAYSKRLLVETKQQYGEHSWVSTDAFVEILARGGKRLRGALVMAAYEMLGGTDQTMAICVARDVEMVQAYLLMTDDIADRSDIRRSGPSAHKLMAAYHKKHQLKGDSEHFGVSISMMSALAHIHRAELNLDELGIPDDIKLQVLKSLHANLIHTLHGQLQDIFIEAVQDPKEADALQVIILKTAHYTLVNPLEMGAFLAGAKDHDINLLRTYGLKAGIAFQLADDILSVFVDSDKSGKSPLDDLKEGKATLLVIHALQKGTAAQTNYLRSVLGNPDLTVADLQKCRDIFTDTGALAYTRQMAADNAQAAIHELDNTPKDWHAEQVEFLRALTGYIVDRQI